MTHPARARPFREPFGSSRPAASGFGATLRASWAQAVQIAPSGAVDEFRRKPARDDFFLAALWESGVSGLRVPFDDLCDSMARDRIGLLASDGFRIQVYGFGLPDATALAALRAGRDHIAAVEITLPPDAIPSSTGAIESLGDELACDTVVSPLLRSGDDPGTAAYVHFIGHGFRPGDPIPDSLRRSRVTGLGFRIGHGMDPLEQSRICTAAADALGKTAHIQVATGGGNPAVMDRDEAAAARRILLAFIAGCCTGKGTRIWLDTLTDVDRGYFPRLGLIDRRSNPRGLALAVDDLARKLSAGDRWEVTERKFGHADETIILRSAETTVEVVLQNGEEVGGRIRQS